MFMEAQYPNATVKPHTPIVRVNPGLPIMHHASTAKIPSKVDTGGFEGKGNLL